MNAAAQPININDDDKTAIMSRRTMVQASSALLSTGLAGLSMAQQSVAALPAGDTLMAPDDPAPVFMRVQLQVNGKRYPLNIDGRTTVLDALREHCGLKGSKKGCDHGQCGACTVISGGRRINSCLTLAVMHEGGKITTIEGLGTPENMHPMQRAFVKHDGYQCGYCTPGQICSAVAMLGELKADYVRTARSKGLPERDVIGRHVMRNALLPFVTIVGLMMANFIGGTVVTESVFTYPGLGRLLIQAISTRDYPLIQGCILFILVVFVLINLLVDVLYAYIDPRIDYG